MMKMTKEVKGFIEGLGKFPELQKLLMSDYSKIKTGITELLLKHRIKLEGSWNSYKLADIDVLYEENPLNVNEKFEFWGITKCLPLLEWTDVTLVVWYKYNMVDMMGNIRDALNVFHVTIRDESGLFRNEWIALITD